MGSLLAVALPLAIGAALSPMLFATTTGLLAGHDRPRGRALAFLVGALVAIGLLVIVAFTAVGPAIGSAVRRADTIIADIDLALGSLLVALALWFAVKPPHPDLTARRHRGGEASRGLWWDGALGLVLQGRDVSSMVLAYGALQHTAVAGVGPTATAAVAAAVVVIVALPVWLPIAAHVTVPPKVGERMARSRSWALHHARGVVITVSLVLGAYLLVRGATGH